MKKWSQNAGGKRQHAHVAVCGKLALFQKCFYPVSLEVPTCNT